MAISSSLPLRNKIAFITGASRGIGQACAISLAKAGAHCIISARTQGGLIQTDNRIRQYGNTATLFPFDLQSSTEIDAIGPSIALQFQRLDIFIHAAFHYVPLTPVTQIMDQPWEKNLSINLTACMKLIRTLSPLLCATPDAQAVFLQFPSQPDPFWGPIASVQAATQALIDCWSKEIQQLANVHIRTLTPPSTQTALRQSFFPAENEQNLNSPEKTARIILNTLFPSIDLP